jgi:uncharacterized membrane protein
MIGQPFIYAMAGATFAAFALINLFDRTNRKRFGSAAFWGLIALSFFAGSWLGDLGNGLLVIALAVIAGLGGIGRGAPPPTALEERRAEAVRRGNRLFLPALIIPATALIGTLSFKHFPALVDPKQVTLVSLTLGVMIALVAIFLWLRPTLAAPYQEGRRLMDSIGWAALLPQMLASLGAVFALAGVGKVVGGIAARAIPSGSLIGAVLAYGLGMVLFTMIMGNAFAAFPVMIAAIGVPLLIQAHHGDPAIVGAVGMLTGFCGTMMTPMAANFNLVPAALLDLRDRYGVIRAQAPTALLLLVVNIGLLYYLGFR